MKKLLLIIIIFVFSLNLFSNIAVFPFYVINNKDEKIPNEWLSEAMFYCLPVNLEQNGFDIIPYMDLKSILYTNNIKYPYYLTKATLIKISSNYDIDYVLWGKIEFIDNKLNISPVIIDINNLKQQSLPIYRGYLKSLFTIINKIVNYTTNYFKKDKINRLDFNIDYHYFEMFIKSHIINNSKNSIKVLKIVQEKYPDTNAINFEIARRFFELKEYDKSIEFLNKMKEDNVFKFKKSFLMGLNLYMKNDFDNSIKYFKKSSSNKKYRNFSLNNIALINIKRNNISKAEKILFNVYDISQDSTILHNLIVLFFKTNKANYIEKYMEKVVDFLRYYPDNSEFTRFFQYIIESDNNKEIEDIFKEYLEDYQNNDNEYDFILINPFSLRKIFAKPKLIKINIKKILKSIQKNKNIDTSIEKYEDLIQENPFVWEYHTILSNLYIRKKKFSKAEKSIKAALYLKKSEINYKTILNLYYLINNKENLKIFYYELRRNFPQSKFLKKYESFIINKK